MSMFDEEDKMYLNVTFTAHGRTHSLSSVYKDDDTWHVLVNDVVKLLESSYGYTFDIDDDIGIYSGRM